MIYLRRVILILLTPMPALSAGPSEDRLLPESFTRTVAISWKQDGRVIDVELKNPQNKWVLTEAKFIVAYPVTEVQPQAKQAAQKVQGKHPATSELDELLKRGYRYRVEPESYSLPIKVLPGRTATVHIELKTTDPISEFKLEEVRGWESTFLDRMQSKVQ